MNIDPSTGRPFGDHGTFEQAMTWVLDVCTDGDVEAATFLRAWRYGATAFEWPEFYDWLNKQPVRDTFQARVAPWMQECFGAEIAADQLERGDRFLEEVLELLQSKGYPRGRIVNLENYVWGRPVGEPSQEVGGVMVTLAAFCLAAGLDMHQAGETELARILQPEIIEKIRAKQASKPRGSALPQ